MWVYRMTYRWIYCRSAPPPLLYTRLMDLWIYGYTRLMDLWIYGFDKFCVTLGN